jgi:hypothetical protein
MSLKVTERKVRELLEEMLIDLTKAENGNKAASQRVRTKSIAFAKVAKEYRKFSLNAEKKVIKKPTLRKTAKKATPLPPTKNRRKG